MTFDENLHLTRKQFTTKVCPPPGKEKTKGIKNRARHAALDRLWFYKARFPPPAVPRKESLTPGQDQASKE